MNEEKKSDHIPQSGKMVQPIGEEADGWISVNDRLPVNDNIRVLAYILDGEHSFMTTTKTRNGKFFVADPAMKAEVTHWQPLPNPPTVQPT